ncbi:AlwI family type II restriction endonuclease [Helicobacter mesocricetorum]|uniref:AlwI family type II restriction endonuclease n=1 Tax=Helicobacter mesocricetorum TaxID=87012 RepID=UPI000CF0F0F5|nr:AlwI family type II restriction endonuclease [Helicobacter mesocricetorum]
MSNRQAQYKILSFSTTMRNPQRIADFLKVLLPYEERILTHEIIMEIIANWIQNKFYIPNYAKLNFKDILESDEAFTDSQIQEIIKNSPQNHQEAGFSRGWDSRFDTFYKLPMEFGFCFYAMNEPLIISHTGHLLIDATNEIPSNETKIANIFLNCMMKYQSNNPFRNILNNNVPLVLLLNVLRKLQEISHDSKISVLEIPFLLCWRDRDYNALTNYILDFRREYPSFAYAREIVYEKCLELLETDNTKRFKISQICNEAVDEYIRKMRITGIISLRGNGRFIDFNTFEMPKINYVLENYSQFKNFSDKKSYFEYMGEIDSHILDIQQSSVIDEESLKLRTLQNFATRYTKEQIYKELSILASKKTKSKDKVLKFIPEPTRFEFLTAIALKQHFKTLQILPNYSIDDEGLPKCHASGNQPDIFCRDNLSQSIIEVSLICGRGQVNNELLPITRHLKSLIESTQDLTNISYFAIFIAPKIFEDSKVYVEFIKFKDDLDIRNFDILEFIERLKIISMESNSINDTFNLKI